MGRPAGKSNAKFRRHPTREKKLHFSIWGGHEFPSIEVRKCFSKNPKIMLSCVENYERITIIDLEFSMVHDGNYVGLFKKSGAEESRSRLKIIKKKKQCNYGFRGVNGYGSPGTSYVDVEKIYGSPNGWVL